jgi:hypothetical protein
MIISNEHRCILCDEHIVIKIIEDVMLIQCKCETKMKFITVWHQPKPNVINAQDRFKLKANRMNL